MSVLGDIRRRADGKQTSNELLVEENERLKANIRNLQSDLTKANSHLTLLAAKYNQMTKENSDLRQQIDEMQKKIDVLEKNGIELAMEDNYPVIRVYKNDHDFPDTSANYRADTFSRW